MWLEKLCNKNEIRENASRENERLGNARSLSISENMTFIGVPQSLSDVLQGRDKRVLIQQHLQKQFEKPLVSFKLNIPGAVKYSPEIHEIFDAGVKAFRQQIEAKGHVIAFEKSIVENTGPEYFAVMEASTACVKALTLHIEDQHPLGRIFDFDVLDEKGVQLSRQDLGMDQRLCLVCEKDAFVCARQRSHELEVLIHKILELHQAFFKGGIIF